MHYFLMVLVAVTAVASFETVGNILVVAMFVVPPAAAYMLTDRLGSMIALSVVLAALSATLGHVGALAVPAWFGYQSTTTAGMMAVAAGVILLLAAMFSPRHGVLVKLIRRQALAWRILEDDIIGLLYRMEERGGGVQTSFDRLRDVLLADRVTLALVLLSLRFRNLVIHTDHGYGLSETGRARAQTLVRSHRLWESYLVEHLGLPPEQVHDPAERTEHFIGQRMREQLAEQLTDAATDPHGRDIP
jgi:manganese/zinc/iron transport system permease protein